MKPRIHFSMNRIISVSIFALLLIILPVHSAILTQLPTKQGDTDAYTEYKGKIVDRKTGTSLAFASLIVTGLNISSMTPELTLP